MSPSRDATFDIARGIAIALMVYGHVFRGLERSNLVVDLPWLSWLDYLIYTFHMPLFFIVSGYFFGRNTFDRPVRRILTNALLFIALPYLVYMNLALVAKIGMAPFVNRPVGDISLASLVVPREHYWFLFALFMATLAGIGMRRLPPVLVMAASLAIGAFRGFDGAVFGIFHFAAGVALARLTPSPLDRLRALGPSALAALAAATLVFAALGLRLDLPSTWIIPAAWAGSAVVIAISSRIASPLLALLGRESMAIFLFHIYITAGCRMLLLAGFGINVVVVHIVVASLAGILIPALGAALLRKAGLNRWILLR